MPNAITASGIHSIVPEEIEVCPPVNAVQAKRAIARLKAEKIGNVAALYWHALQAGQRHTDDVLFGRVDKLTCLDLSFQRLAYGLGLRPGKPCRMTIHVGAPLQTWRLLT